MRIKELCGLIETLAPLSFQESYDNAGLTVGSPDWEVSAALLCLDVTEETVDEAIELNANIIISHHPVIFSGLKQIVGKNTVERIILKCIQNNIALYAAHTNLDSVQGGVNDWLARKLNLTGLQILSPLKGHLVKVVTFVPISYAEEVRAAMFKAGAGSIGDYDSCSYNIEGKGTFRALENANPFVGAKGELHFENEVRIESICLRNLANRVVEAMILAHPYEEPAYDIIPLDNDLKTVGIGMIGTLTNALPAADFLEMVKNSLSCEVLRYSTPCATSIKRVAVCSGSGASFASLAIAQNADALVTADVKYHNFIDAEAKILLVDAGHFETERFTIDIFYDFITKKMVNFAVYKTKHIYNPVNYLFH